MSTIFHLFFCPSYKREPLASHIFSIIGHFLVIPINLLAFIYTILVSLSFKYAYRSLHHLLLFTHLLDLGLDSDFSSYLLMAVDFCLQTSLFGYLFLPDTPHHLQ